MTQLQQLLDPSSLPAYFNTDPVPAQGITLAYTGTSATVTIANGSLTTSVNGGTGTNLSLDLTQYTLTQLVTAINASSGYTATLLGPTTTSALLLIETSNTPITSTVSLAITTSMLYKIMIPVAVEMYKAKTAIDSALLEQILFKADDGWIDYWGYIYGDITRNSGESDTAYAARIIAEVTRNRLSIRAIQDAVLALDSITIGVSSGGPDVVKVVGATNVGQNLLQDRQHAGAQMIVTGISQNVSTNATVHSTIDANRAAGINPIYNYTTPNFSGCFVLPFCMDIFPIAPNT